MNAKKKFIQGNLEISQETVDYGWTMPYAHYHEDYEIYILTSGERTVTIDDTIYFAPAKSATLFPQNTVHKSTGTTPFSGICIHFSQRFAQQYFTPLAMTELLRCFEHPIIPLTDEAMSYIKKVADEFVLDSTDHFLQLATILHVLCTYANQMVSSHSHADSISDHSVLSKADSIIAYVDENYCFIHEISELATYFDVSESYIFRIFKQRFQTTPKHYINQLRINTVCHRLRYSNKSVRLIAADCGFASYEYFYRVFKAQMGCTPTEYRDTFFCSF